MRTHVTPDIRMPRPIASRSIPYPRFSYLRPSCSLVQILRRAPLGVYRVAYTLDYGDLHRRESIGVNEHAPFIFLWPAWPLPRWTVVRRERPRPITISVIEMCVWHDSQS